MRARTVLAVSFAVLSIVAVAGCKHGAKKADTKDEELKGQMQKVAADLNESLVRLSGHNGPATSADWEKWMKEGGKPSEAPPAEEEKEKEKDGGEGEEGGEGGEEGGEGEEEGGEEG